jgi:hypothetical protein
MVQRAYRRLSLAVLIACAVLLPGVASAHRSGCHRWHTCPSDTGSYTEVAPPQSPPQNLVVPPSVDDVATPPAVDWQTYDTATEFASYWRRNGDLPVFGFAKSRPYRYHGRLTQVFERNRLEFHPENVAPYNIQLGLLGEERLLQLGRVWHNEPKSAPQAGCRFFPETGHNLCEPFLTYWQTHGLTLDNRRGYSEAESLALFGYPITDISMEVGADGVTRPTQWFQRARFEDHGNGTVLLGLLGNEVYQQ